MISRMPAVVLALCLQLFCSSPEAGISDRVVASVDNQAITRREFSRALETARQKKPEVTESEVINAMINRKLLLMSARKYRIEEYTEDGIIREYIDLKIRAYVRVTPENVETFYLENEGQFEGKSLAEVREEIENFLEEKEINRRLGETLEELRKAAYIRIQLDEH